MGAPYHKAMRKIEDAVEAVIKSLRDTFLSGVTFFKGVSGSELSVPRVEVVANEADPEHFGEHYTGNFRVTLTIAVVEDKGDAARATLAEHCGAVEDAIMRDDFEELANNASGVTDFKMFDPGWKPGKCVTMTDGDQIRVEYQAEAYVRPSLEE